MLMGQLGYRAPAPDEEARALALSGFGQPGQLQTPRPLFYIPAAVLNEKPLISYSGMVPHSPLGLASIAATDLRGRPAWFLISPTWSIEEDGAPEQLRILAIVHRHRNPNHRLIFVCNTPGEADKMQGCGEAAFFYNKTASTSERTFRPLDGAAPAFDAIYNALLAPWKRHHLSLEIPTCAFLFYRDDVSEGSASAEARIMACHTAVPRHVFINPLDKDQRPIRLTLSEVNRHLNRASVGLCLSEKEGAMFASTEYLLSGLPIVTTPSIGGRHVYHDEEYCRTVPPDPRSVADAVRALKDRDIPRAYIRGRTLRRLECDRARFMTLINTILEECGAARRLAGPWPFRKDVTMEWLPPSQALARVVYEIVDGFGKPKRGLMRWRKWKHALGLTRSYDAG